MSTQPEQSRKPIIGHIEGLVNDIPGWCPLDQLHSLFMLAMASADLPGDILELGSWCGRSAAALAMATRLVGKGHVHCVDLFPEKGDWYENQDGSYSMQVAIGEKIFGAYQQQTVWKEPFERDILPVYEKYPGVFQAFQKAMQDRQLEPYVTPFKGDLEMFTQTAPKNFALRMAFIDGDHSYQAVANDIARVEQFLLPGGWICFDDAFSTYNGVNAAIEQYIIASGKYDILQQLTRKFFVARFKH